MKVFKLFCTNLAFFVLLLLIGVAILNGIEAQSTSFENNLNEIGQLDQITEGEFDSMYNYFGNFLNFIIFAAIAYPILIFIIWALLNVVENNILHSRNVSSITMKHLFFQLGLVVLFVFCMILLSTGFSVINAFIYGFISNVFLDIVVLVILIIMIILLSKTYYLICFNESYTKAMNKIATKKLINWKSVGRMFVFLIAFLFFSGIILLIPSTNLFYFVYAIFLSFFLGYMKVYLYTLFHK